MNIQSKREEKEYRGLDKPSYSLLKEFASSREDYFRKYILREEVEKRESDDMTRGRVIETLLFEPEYLEDRFFVSTVDSDKLPKEGTNMHKYVKELVKITSGEKLKAWGDGGAMDGYSWEDALIDAYNRAGISKPGVEKFLEGYGGSEAEKWYYELMETERTVISSHMLLSSERNKGYLEPLLEKETEGKKVLYQQTMEWVYNDLELKGMADMITLDEKRKIAQPYDLKCTWELEEFWKNYIKNKYYLQGAVYDSGIKDMLGSEWTVNPMKFITCDSKSSLKPIIYSMTELDRAKAYTGFWNRGYYNKGLNEVIEEFLWHHTTNVWDMSKGAYENNGKKLLGIKYE